MINNSPQHVYDQLHSSLWDRFVFFIPKFEFPEDVKNELQFLEEFEMFNVPLHYRKKEGVFSYSKDYSLQVMSKGKELESNLFLLLELKGALKQYEFDYIIEKYFEISSCLFFLTDWLNNNKNDLSDLHKDMYGVFFIQLTFHSNHFGELIKHFYPDKQNMPFDKFNITDLIKKHLPEITKRYHKEDRILILPPLNNIKITDPILPTPTTPTTPTPTTIGSVKKKLRKRPLITVEDAEKELLSIVFKV